MERADLGDQLAGRADRIRDRLRAGVVVARDESPEVAVTAERHRETRRHAHVPEVLRVHDRGSAEGAVGHLERLVRRGMRERNELGELGLDIRHGTTPHLLEDLARRLGNVLRRVVQAEPWRAAVDLALGEYLAMAVRMELVDHHAIEPGDGADLLGHRATQLEHRHGALEVADARLERPIRVGRGAVGAPRGFELDDRDAVERVDGDVERRGPVPRGKRQDVERILVAPATVEKGTELRLALLAEHRGRRPAQERGWGDSEDRLRALAHLQDLEIRRVEDEENAVRLDAARRLDRLAIAVRQRHAVALDAVRTVGPRKRARRLLFD